MKRPDGTSPPDPPGARRPGPGSGEPLLLVAHPSPDLYGSDRQLLETVTAAVEGGWRVRVFLPSSGPLVPLLEQAGASVEVSAFPVLRKTLLRPTRLPGLVFSSCCGRGPQLADARRSAPRGCPR